MKSLKTINILVTLFSIVIIAVSVVTNLYFWKKISNSQKNQNGMQISQRALENQIEILQNQLAKLFQSKIFRSEKSSLIFAYPSEWEDLKEEFEMITGQITIRKGNDIIMAANNPDYKALGDRGPYWGDEAKFIIDQSYIMKFCEGKEKCEVKTNLNNVRYAKIEKEVCQEGGICNMATNYYIYNPVSLYRGIIFSTYNLQKEKITDLEEKFDGMIESLKFID